MNPIFAAHLVADFLFQPNFLAEWKQKSVSGIFSHAIMHGLTMGILILPFVPAFAPFVFAIAAIHAAIDQWKISYHKRYGSFAAIFITDQIAHLVVMYFFYSFMPYKIMFWNSNFGIWILTVLMASSFMIGLWHISRTKILPFTMSRRKIQTTILVAATFIIFIVPAVLL